MLAGSSRSRAEPGAWLAGELQCGELSETAKVGWGDGVPRAGGSMARLREQRAAYGATEVTPGSVGRMTVVATVRAGAGHGRPSMPGEWPGGRDEEEARQSRVYSVRWGAAPWECVG